VVAPPFPFPAFSRLCVAYCLGELFEPDNRMFVFLPLVISITVVTAMVCMACMGNPSDGGDAMRPCVADYARRIPSIVAMQIQAAGHMSPAND
jgi:hypothetical protein